MPNPAGHAMTFVNFFDDTKPYSARCECGWARKDHTLEGLYRKAADHLNEVDPPPAAPAETTAERETEGAAS